MAENRSVRQPQLVTALDLGSHEEAMAAAHAAWPRVQWFKVGLELFTAAGPPVAEDLKDMGALVFLDLKLHDILNTVSRAARAAVRLGVDMLTVHASGGREMMEETLRAVREEAGELGRPAPRVVAVTVLTSMTRKVLEEIGAKSDLEQQVVRLALLAREAGLDGVVASPLEIQPVRSACGPDFLLVTPGVRPPGAESGDQRRFWTPREAVAAGADFLVVGRPITRAPDAARAAEAILQEMEEGRRGAQ